MSPSAASPTASSCAGFICRPHGSHLTLLTILACSIGKSLTQDRQRLLKLQDRIDRKLVELVVLH